MARHGRPLTEGFYYCSAWLLCEVSWDGAAPLLVDTVDGQALGKFLDCPLFPRTAGIYYGT